MPSRLLFCLSALVREKAVYVVQRKKFSFIKIPFCPVRPWTDRCFELMKPTDLHIAVDSTDERTLRMEKHTHNTLSFLGVAEAMYGDSCNRSSSSSNHTENFIQLLPDPRRGTHKPSAAVARGTLCVHRDIPAPLFQIQNRARRRVKCKD